MELAERTQFGGHNTYLSPGRSGAEDPNQPPARPPDENRVTKTTYTPWGAVAAVTAVDPNANGAATADDQVTLYTYSDGNAADCPVPRTDLLIREKYPDGDDSADNIRHAYFAGAHRRSRTDQRGVRHGKLRTVTTFSAAED